MDAPCAWEGTNSCWQAAKDWFTWQGTKDFFNSAFFTSALGALAGAWAGALAAQKIAKRDKHSDELVAKIRDTNAALAIVFSMVNSFLGLKKQHVKEMVDSHKEETVKVKELELRRRTGFTQGNMPYRFEAKMRTLEPMSAPTEQLFQLLLTKLTITNRPLSFAMMLTATLDRFNGAIKTRNALIQQFKAEDYPRGAALLHLYFGLPYAGSHVNEEYPSVLYGIGSYLDDLIFFSKQLNDDLTAYGHELIKRYEKEVGKKDLRLSSTNFDTLEARGLIPDASKYESILSAFQKREPKSSWRKRVASRLLFWRRNDRLLTQI